MSKDNIAFELPDDKLDNVSGGCTNNNNRKYYFSSVDNVDVLVGFRFIRLSDGKSYQCSSFENYDRFTRYYFVRTDGTTNTMFSIDWSKYGGTCDQIRHD